MSSTPMRSIVRRGDAKVCCRPSDLPRLAPLHTVSLRRCTTDERQEVEQTREKNAELVADKAALEAEKKDMQDQIKEWKSQVEKVERDAQAQMTRDRDDTDSQVLEITQVPPPHVLVDGLCPSLSLLTLPPTRSLPPLTGSSRVPSCGQPPTCANGRNSAYLR